MGLFWKNGATWRQKFMASIFILFFLPAPYISIFMKDFVIEPKVSLFVSYVSIVFTAVIVLSFAYFFSKNKLVLDPIWNTYSKIKKLSVIMFCPVFICLFVWINLSKVWPYIFTLAYGDYYVKNDIVVRGINSSRYSCDYQLEPRSIKSFGFQYCISEKLYNKLPDFEIESELVVKKSAFGYIVEDIRLLNN